MFLIKDVIFIPGNHDGDFWHLVDYEINVIKPMRKMEEPRSLRRSVPGVIDDRGGTQTPGLRWPATGLVHSEERGRDSKRDGLFIDRLFRDAGGEHEDARFWVCYPNLYLVTDEECVLITHGHYFKTYWAMTAEIAMELAPQGLGYDHEPDRRFESFSSGLWGQYAPVDDFVGMNFPLSQISCTGVGQAAPLTRLARMVQKDVKEHDTRSLHQYVRRLPAALAASFDKPWLKWALKAPLAAIELFARQEVNDYEDARGNKELLRDEKVAKRFVRYLLSCQKEIDEINRSEWFAGAEIPPLTRVIFGHTHEPTGWEEGEEDPFQHQVDGRTINTHNTGGWLEEPEGAPVKAEAFFYENGKFNSVRIS